MARVVSSAVSALMVQYTLDPHPSETVSFSCSALLAVLGRDCGTVQAPFARVQKATCRFLQPVDPLESSRLTRPASTGILAGLPLLWVCMLK
jgi:hypothetical protein